jgi:RNA polymerase sigma factor (sigma-70 family)
MTPNEAGATVRAWAEVHVRSVLHALASCGVPRDDRPDLAQEVFLTAYAHLVRSDDAIETPRAWLVEIARKKASNYRRHSSRRLHAEPVEAAPSALPDPEQETAQRELVWRAMEQLDEEAQSLLLDVRVYGLSWTEVAEERGITVPQAKYLYRVALQRLKEASSRIDPATRRSFVVVAAQEAMCTAPRLEPSGFAALRARLWSSLTEHPLGSIFGALGGAIALGVLLSELLCDPSARMPLSTPPPLAAPPVARVLDESPGQRGVPPPTRLASASAGEPTRPVPAPGPQKRLPGPLALLDQARAAVAADDPRTALAALAEHARRFPRGPGAAERHHLLTLACAIPAARGAPACAGTQSEPGAL